MKITSKIINAYRVFQSFDLELMFHMTLNRIRHPHFLDFLKADWPYKFRFLHKHYDHLLEKCRQNPVSNQPNTGPIWVFWWQGEEHMPDIVRFCYASLKKNAPADRPIHLLHQDNYREYTDIPDYIIHKLEKKAMTLTHFSDIVRMSLLSRYGGLWIDATVYLSGKMPDCVFEHSYFSGKEPFYPHSVCRSEYTVFMIGAAAQAPWVVFARDFLYEYWKTSWKLLDYALINFILTMALDSIPELRNEVEKGILNTPHINTIQNKRNEACDPAVYQQMIKECSFYKLSYKLNFQEYDKNGNLTYYGMMRQSEQQ